MPSRPMLRVAAWTAAAMLVALLLLYASSFIWTFSRISLDGVTLRLDRGTFRANWLSTPTPWRSAFPAPGWHIHRGPVGLRFTGMPALQGRPSPMYGLRSATLRAEFVLAPLALAWLALHLLARRHPPGHCRRCGYSRSGLPPRAPCPECGRASPAAAVRAARSLTAHPLLAPTPSLS